MITFAIPVLAIPGVPHAYLNPTDDKDVLENPHYLLPRILLIGKDD
jgi:hypothetical protein